MFSKMQTWIKKFSETLPEWKDEPGALSELFWDTLEQNWSGENADNKMMSRRVIAPLEKWPHMNGIENVVFLNETSTFIDIDSDFKFSHVLMSIFRAAKHEPNAFFVMKSLVALILQRRETDELRRMEEEYAMYVPYIEIEEALQSVDDEDEDIAKAVNKTDEASEDDAKKKETVKNPAEERLIEIDDAICECIRAIFLIMRPYEPFSTNIRKLVTDSDAAAKKSKGGDKSGSSKSSPSNSPGNSIPSTPNKRKREETEKSGDGVTAAVTSEPQAVQKVSPIFTAPVAEIKDVVQPVAQK